MNFEFLLRQPDKLLVYIDSLLLFRLCFSVSVIVFCITGNHFDCPVTSAVTAFSFLQIDLCKCIVYISHRFVVFSFTLYCILISYIVDKFLFKQSYPTLITDLQNPSYTQPVRIKPLSERCVHVMCVIKYFMLTPFQRFDLYVRIWKQSSKSRDYVSIVVRKDQNAEKVQN